MIVEQPELGNVGIEQATVMLTWTWERGWVLRTAGRPSGSDRVVERSYEGHDEAELHAILTDWAAEMLGLV